MCRRSEARLSALAEAKIRVFGVPICTPIIHLAGAFQRVVKDKPNGSQVGTLSARTSAIRQCARTDPGWANWVRTRLSL